MAISFICKCGKPLRAHDDAAGKRTRCPHCFEVMLIPGVPAKSGAMAGAGKPSASGGDDDGLALDLDWNALEAPAAPVSNVEQSARDAPRTGSSSMAISAIALAELPNVPEGVRQYRVLSQKDLGMTGKFNAAKLEETLNAYALQGWTLKSAVTLNLPSHSGNHDEIVVILERES